MFDYFDNSYFDQKSMSVLEKLFILDPKVYRESDLFKHIKIEDNDENLKKTQESLKKLRDESSKKYFNPNATSNYRTYASQTLIEQIKPRSVLEIGVGKDGITYNQLFEAGKNQGFNVNGIELDFYNAVGLENVIVSDVLSVTDDVSEIINASDMIRSSNTVLPYFLENDVKIKNQKIAKFFGIMERYMADDANLIITHTSANPRSKSSEEGILYSKKSGILEMDGFIFSYRDNGIGDFNVDNGNKFSIAKYVLKSLIDIYLDYLPPVHSLSGNIQKDGIFSKQEERATESLIDLLNENEIPAKRMGIMVHIPINHVKEALERTYGF